MTRLSEYLPEHPQKERYLRPTDVLSDLITETETERLIQLLAVVIRHYSQPPQTSISLPFGLRLNRPVNQTDVRLTLHGDAKKQLQALTRIRHQKHALRLRTVKIGQPVPELNYFIAYQHILALLERQLGLKHLPPNMDHEIMTNLIQFSLGVSLAVARKALFRITALLIANLEAGFCMQLPFGMRFDIKSRRHKLKQGVCYTPFVAVTPLDCSLASSSTERCKSADNA